MNNQYTVFAREGNKSRYLDCLYPLFPKSFRNYVEPFLGTGAVFLGLPIQPVNSFVNDHDKFIFYFFLTMSTYRGADSLAQRIKEKLIYYPLLNALQKRADLLDFLATKILYQATSMYSYGQTLNLTPNNSKENVIEKLYTLKQYYLAKMQNTKITNMSYDKFLKSLGSKHGSFKDFFVYADPPYSLEDKGNLSSNKAFTKDDLENLVVILKSRDWKYAISCMDSGVDFYRQRGLFITKVKKSSGIAASKGLIKHEWLATNYPPPRENQALLF